MPSKVVSNIAGYSVLPVQLPARPSFNEAATHYLYIQAHTPRQPDADASRSLFVVNVPTTSTETHFRHLFGTQLGTGRVERVDFHYGSRRSMPATLAAKESGKEDGKNKSKKRKREEETVEEYESQLEGLRLPTGWDRELRPSGSHAVVTFVDRPSMEASLKAVRKKAKSASIVWGEGLEESGKVPLLGQSRYSRHLVGDGRYPGRAELLRCVNEYMVVLSRFEEAQERAAARQGEVVDEDGFVTVTRGTKQGGHQQRREEELRALAERQREKNRGLEDFYRFQMREKRKERQGELLRRFEEDKRRVEEMKRRRGRVIPES